jgi:GcrA cell cycle regulator
MDWTQEQVDALGKLWIEGLTTAEIGRRLGITKNAVVGKVNRLHLAPRQSPIKRVEKPPVIELKGPACSWPIGHPREPGFHFCGAAPVTGKPYCTEHAAKAYVAPSRPSRSDRSDRPVFHAAK